MPDSDPTPDSGYQVLARRYRSRTFGEVVGQETIADTLERAIEKDRTAHAYLFCGTRGVGKTSMARIFARALNASAGDDPQEASVLRGEDLDVIEIDGASNNSVQDARDLIANASVLPARAPYKVYIIDEVHMLSTAAFNALLKTMEEPPPHVKFILCTTEPHKVLPTIQSRCQRFDFRPIPVPRIADHLRSVLESESIPADDVAIARVARMANGSMRDGLSILERLVAASEEGVDLSLLERVLGVPPEDRVAAAVAAIGAGDVGGALRATADLLGEGLPAERVLDGLAERYRQLLVAATCGADAAMLETGEAEAETLATEGRLFDPAQLVHLIALCDAAAQRVRTSTVPRAVIDAVVARMALSERFRDAAGLLSGESAPTGRPKKKSLSPSDRTVAPRKSLPEPPRSRDDRGPTPAPPAKPVERPKPRSPEAVEAPSGSASGSASGGASSGASSPPPASDPSPRKDSAPVGVWDRLLEAASSARQRAVLADFEFERLEGATLHVRVRDDASPAAAFTVEHPEVFEELASTAFERRMTVRFVDRPRRTTDRVIEASEDRDGARDHPIVQEAMDLFDADVVQVRRTSKSAETESTNETTPDTEA